MSDLKYDLIIEASADSSFFGFYSSELEGFTGIEHSIEDCLYKARWGMEEHVELVRQQGMPVPDTNAAPTIVIHNEAEKGAVQPRKSGLFIHYAQGLSACKKRRNSDSSMP